jgi:putative alpha-1,2-mannosidase
VHDEILTFFSSSIWDLFRSQLPFLTITDPAAHAQMIRSLIDIYKNVGWLPDCRMSFNKGYTQVSYKREILNHRTKIYLWNSALDADYYKIPGRL